MELQSHTEVKLTTFLSLCELFLTVFKSRSRLEEKKRSPSIPHRRSEACVQPGAEHNWRRSLSEALGLRGGAPREKLTNRRKSPQRRFLEGKVLKILELLKNDFGVFPRSSFVVLDWFLTF